MSKAHTRDGGADSAASVDWAALPKALLHEHLDGGLRAQTLLELCRAQGIALPAQDAAELARWMLANAHAGSLERYLLGFELTVRAMASAAACERVAYEAAEDARRDGCVLAEFRIAPLLLQAHGLAPEAAVEALLAGLARSAMPCGLIVCAMRHEPTERSLAAARLAARYRDAGVIGFDLAGAERGNPPARHAAAFAAARDAGLGLTCHAGEDDSGERVLEAAALGATRIGHGVRLLMGEAREEWRVAALAQGLHFEVCPTSNVHTGVVPDLAAHPIGAMCAAGLSVSCSTDNRLMSGVSLSGELHRLHAAQGLSLAQLGRMMTEAANASFLAAPVRDAAVRRIRQGFGLP